MRPNIGESGLDFGNVVGRAGSLRRSKQVRTLRIGAEHEIEQACAAFRCLLNKAADPRSWRKHDFAAVRCDFSGDSAEQARLSDAVSADEADPGSGGDADRRAVE